jgi:hypothetical protein
MSPSLHSLLIIYLHYSTRSDNDPLVESMLPCESHAGCSIIHGGSVYLNVSVGVSLVNSALGIESCLGSISILTLVSLHDKCLYIIHGGC